MQERQETGSIPGLEDSLEENMATHSSILTCIIPQTEEPGGLQSIESELATTEVTEHFTLYT